jgi:hypothetical protein
MEKTTPLVEPHLHDREENGGNLIGTKLQPQLLSKGPVHTWPQVLRPKSLEVIPCNLSR